MRTFIDCENQTGIESHGQIYNENLNHFLLLFVIFHQLSCLPKKERSLIFFKYVETSKLFHKTPISKKM